MEKSKSKFVSLTLVSYQHKKFPSSMDTNVGGVDPKKRKTNR